MKNTLLHIHIILLASINGKAQVKNVYEVRQPIKLLRAIIKCMGTTNKWMGTTGKWMSTSFYRGFSLSVLIITVYLVPAKHTAIFDNSLRKFEGIMKMDKLLISITCKDHESTKLRKAYTFLGKLSK